MMQTRYMTSIAEEQGLHTKNLYWCQLL